MELRKGHNKGRNGLAIFSILIVISQVSAQSTIDLSKLELIGKVVVKQGVAKLKAFYGQKEDKGESWVDGLSLCQLNRMVLATIENGKENELVGGWLQQIQNSGAKVTEGWLGGTDRVLEGKWTWSSTGKQITYANWLNPKSKSVKNNTELNCMTMTHGIKGVWKWSPIHCDIPYARAICSVMQY